jgi:predicted lipoprotein
MPTSVDISPAPAPRAGKTSFLMPSLLLVLLVGAALDTRVVRIGSDQDQRAVAFSAETWGKKNFTTLQAAIESAAVDAPLLASSITADKAAAGEKYGKPGSVGPIFPVKFSGVVGELRAGLATVAVAGLPEGLVVRVQTGPAVNGTDVRDATGTISFGQFTNQIEYQDAGAALNDQIKAQVLGNLDRDSLSGKTIEVVGVFQLINPTGWLVTPVRMGVQ